MTLKIKGKNIIWTKLYFRQFMSRENLNYRSLFVYKGTGSGIFPDPDPGDPKRPDPTGSGSATLPFIQPR